MFRGVRGVGMGWSGCSGRLGLGLWCSMRVWCFGVWVSGPETQNPLVTVAFDAVGFSELWDEVSEYA